MCVALEETSHFTSDTLHSNTAIEFAMPVKQVSILSNFVLMSARSDFSSLNTSAILAILALAYRSEVGLVELLCLLPY